MSQQAGAPFQGDTPGFAVDTSLGTQIERYHVVQVSENTTTANNMMVGLCGTNDTGRVLSIGTAFTAWQYPPDPRIYEPASQPSSDIGSGYDVGKYEMLGVRLEGTTWAKVQIPGGGSDVTFVVGDHLVPSTVVEGCVMPKPATSLTASYASADIVADLVEERAVIGRLMSVIHVPASGASWGARPSFQAGTLALTLTAITNAVTFGYVFTKIGKR